MYIWSIVAKAFIKILIMILNQIHGFLEIFVITIRHDMVE